MATIVGKEPQAIRRCTCRNCASIIEYTQSETVTRWVSDYSGDREQIRELRCPGCGKEIQVKYY
jgi:RNase P subunit RPR2